VSDDDEDDGEEMPEPISADVKGINLTRKVETPSNSDVSDIDVDDYNSETEEYDSDELCLETTENPHGFVFGNMLETFSKSRKDRIEEMRNLKDPDHRDKYKKK
jgi:hypothetical protein